MNLGAPYDQVAKEGFVTALPLNNYASQEKLVQEKFLEEKINLARYMATVVIDDEKKINRPLMSALLTEFDYVKCAVFLTKDQVSSRKERKETFIFVLQDVQTLQRGVANRVEKPHKGRLVLCRDEEDELYVPVFSDSSGNNAAMVPLILTQETIEDIGGRIGRKLGAAFRDGQKDLLRHDTKPVRVKREEEIERLAIEEMASYESLSLTASPKLADFAHG